MVRLVFFVAVLPGSLLSQAVWTGHFDNLRTGAYTQESILTPANVNRAQFGRLASLPVTGCVFAQPLYVPGVPTVTGTHRNLLILATTTNNVYEYDADDYTLYFSGNFGPPVPSVLIDPNNGYYDFLDCDDGEGHGGNGPIGIVGTPVIDVFQYVMYFVANTFDGSQHHHVLHKISLTTGADVIPPVEITGSYSGVPFQSRYELQRCALLLHNGWIYIAFASHHDETPYYGWMFAYDSNLTQMAVMNYSPSKSGSGIWQSGAGPATDGRYIYFNTGNNVEDVANAGDNSESILAVDPITLGVAAKTSFYPEGIDWDWNLDLDLGSSRIILLPGTPYAVSGSKLGDMFIVDRRGMKLTHRQQVAARQSSNVDWTGIYNGFAYWNGKIYVWPGGGGFIYGPQPPFPTDTLKAYALNARGSSARLVANGQTDGTGVGYQGANLMISANGNDSSTGIVWAYVPALNTLELQPGYLHAYSASDFSGGMFQELWNNNIPDSPDQGCEFAKFTQPVVANGKAFLPTFCGKVIVYGLTSNPALTHGAAKRRPH